MKRYYLDEGVIQAGPFDVEELRRRKIKPETRIWHEGLSDWTNAGSVMELKFLFSKSVSEPFKLNTNFKELEESNVYAVSSTSTKKLETKALGNKAFIVLFFFVLVLITICLWLTSSIGISLVRMYPD